MKIKIKKSMIKQAIREAWMPRPMRIKKQPKQVDVTKKMIPMKQAAGVIGKIVNWLKNNFVKLSPEDKSMLMRAMNIPFSRGSVVNQDASTEPAITAPVPVMSQPQVKDSNLGPLDDIVGWLKNNYSSLPRQHKLTLSKVLGPVVNGRSDIEADTPYLRQQTVLQSFRGAMLDEATSVKQNRFTRMVADQMQSLWNTFIRRQKRKGRTPTVDRFNLIIKQATDQGGIAEERYMQMVQKMQEALQHGQIAQTGEQYRWWRSRNKGTTDPNQKFTQKGTMGHQIKSKAHTPQSQKEIQKNIQRQSW